MEIGGALVLLLVTICTPGCEADPCYPTVKGSRRTLNVTEGAKAQMQCAVEHCGEAHWRGGWGRISEPFDALHPTPRHRLYNRSLTANVTALYLEILHTNRSDAGLYQCRIHTSTQTLNGHLTTLHVIAGIAVAGEMVRSRVAMYLGVCVYILLILVLTCFLSPACRKCCHPSTMDDSPEGRVRLATPAVGHMLPTLPKLLASRSALIYPSLVLPCMGMAGYKLVHTAKPATVTITAGVVVYASVLLDSDRTAARQEHLESAPPIVYSSLQFPLRQSYTPRRKKEVL